MEASVLSEEHPAGLSTKQVKRKHGDLQESINGLNGLQEGHSSGEEFKESPSVKKQKTAQDANTSFSRETKEKPAKKKKSRDDSLRLKTLVEGIEKLNYSQKKTKPSNTSLDTDPIAYDPDLSMKQDPETSKVAKPTPKKKSSKPPKPEGQEVPSSLKKKNQKTPKDPNKPKKGMFLYPLQIKNWCIHCE